jgi:hypothetical protein
VIRESDIDRLTADHPAWDICSTWVTCASGPDTRTLTARRGGLTVCAFTAPCLARQMADAEAQRGWHSREPRS